ncbi:MAG: prenyltransferase, partial [Bdellovibrionales bacterium]|nr:prenyltransferase [Bdellovibrionales bacterium]
MNTSSELVVLPLSHADCQKYLQCSRQGENVFLPREVIPGVTSQEDKVVFEKRVATPVPILRAYFQSLRAISLTATGAPCVAMLLLGHNLGWPIDIWKALAAVLGVLLLQIAVNVLNDIGDHLRLIDLPGTWGGSGVLQNGWLTVKDLRRLAVFAIILGGLLGLFALRDHLQLVGGAVICIAALGTIGYSGRALQLKYRALGDITVWLLCGPALTIGFALAAFGEWNEIVIWMGALFGFLACGILHVNNL